MHPQSQKPKGSKRKIKEMSNVSVGSSGNHAEINFFDKEDSRRQLNSARKSS
jgi:hypothetical protein